MVQFFGHVAFDFKLYGSIPTIIVGFDSHTPHHPTQSCLVCKEKWVAPPPSKSSVLPSSVGVSPKAAAKMITFCERWLETYLH